MNDSEVRRFYKCRLCNEVFQNDDEQRQRFLNAERLFLANFTKLGSFDVVVNKDGELGVASLVTFHVCKDGATGVCDFLGMRRVSATDAPRGDVTTSFSTIGKDGSMFRISPADPKKPEILLEILYPFSPELRAAFTIVSPQQARCLALALRAEADRKAGLV